MTDNKNNAFDIGQEVWFICKDDMEILRTTDGEAPHFDHSSPNVLHRGHIERLENDDVVITLETYMNEPSGRKESRERGCGVKRIYCRQSDVFCTPESAIAAFTSKIEGDLMKQLAWFKSTDTEKKVMNIGDLVWWVCDGDVDNGKGGSMAADYVLYRGTVLEIKDGMVITSTELHAMPSKEDIQWHKEHPEELDEIEGTIESCHHTPEEAIAGANAVAHETLRKQLAIYQARDRSANATKAAGCLGTAL